MRELVSEQRMSVRFPVHAPVIFAWTDSGGPQRGMGFTRDMCRSGAYVLCRNESVVPVGMRIEMELLLPSLGGRTEGVRLQAEGSVARPGHADESIGFAVMIQFR
jgi:hypothetical protein